MQLCKKTTVMQQSVHAYISIYFYRMLLRLAVFYYFYSAIQSIDTRCQ